MTYLDLLLRIKAGARPVAVEFNDLVYSWNGHSYKTSYGKYLSDDLSDTDMVEADCIKALQYEVED